MHPHYLDPALVRSLVEAALQADGAGADVTTTALVPPDLRGTAVLRARAAGVIAGLPAVAVVLEAVDHSIAFEPRIWDGQRVSDGDLIAELSGPLASMLRAERTALTFLRRLSGIATATARAIAAVHDARVRVVEGRPATSELRSLDRYAVRVGGGHNHRRNLSDGVVITANHVAALRARGLSITEGVTIARSGAPHTLRVTVEAVNVPQVVEALVGGADVILLTRMSLDELRDAVARCRGRALTEAAAAGLPASLREIAEAGVDLIAIDALTDGVSSLDVELEIGGDEA